MRWKFSAEMRDMTIPQTCGAHLKLWR